MKLPLHPAPTANPVHLTHERAPLTVLSPAPREVWETLYKTDPEALPTQSPRWLDGICGFGPYVDASRLYTFADGQQVVLPLVRRRGLPGRLSVQASFPYAWGTGGVLSRYPLRPADLVGVLNELSSSALATRLYPNPRQHALWHAAQPRGALVLPRRAHVLELDGGFDRVWQERFASKTRNKVRKAKKLGVVVESDSTGRLMPVFYELYRRSVDRWAAQQNEPRWLAHLRAKQRDPLAKLEHLARHLGKACRVWVAFHAGQPVAAAVVLLGRNADYILGAMDKTLAAPVNANDLLQACAIEEACATGCSLYHMGESGDSAGIADFKERLGAKAYAFHEYRLERLPLSRLDLGLRSVVKRVIGFQD
jgi:hypothetical protein